MSQMLSLPIFSEIPESIPEKDIIRKERKEGRTRFDNRRYYLHRRVRMTGIEVNARERTIELSSEEMFSLDKIQKKYLNFLNEINYSIQSVIMKAKDTIPPDNKTKESTEVAIPVSILKAEEVAAQFDHISKKVDKFNKLSLNIDIKDESTLTAAENNSKDIRELLKATEVIRKTLKGPYIETGKVIESYAKTISEPLSNASDRFKEKISNYKTVQEAAKRAEAEKIEKELRATEEEKKEELAKLQRVSKQLYARLYGGVFSKRDGTKESVAGCIAEQDCDNLTAFINEKYPKAESYKHFSVMSEEFKSEILKKIAEHKVNIIESGSSDDSTQNAAKKRINTAKNDAEIESSDTFEKVEESVEKETAKGIKSAEKEAKDAGKGVRRVLQFKVLDPILVPREYLIVDEKKLREHMNANSDMIKEKLKEGSDGEILPGIKFFMHETFVAS